MTEPPHITIKQFAILTNIYRFRFLNRVQIQTLLNHKDYRRINAWLKDLTDKKCLERIYSHTMPENTKPAVYYLGKNGRRWLSGDDHYLGIEELELSHQYRDEQLKKTYKDNQRTEAYRLDCLAIAECYLVIQESAKKYNKRVWSQTHSEYGPYDEMLDVLPDLFINISPSAHDYEPEEEEMYLLFYITNRKQKKYIRYRIFQVINDLQNDEYLEFELKPFKVLFVAANTPLRNYTKRVLERKLEDVTDNLNIECKLTTLAEFKNCGLYGNIWKNLKKN